MSAMLDRITWEKTTETIEDYDDLIKTINEIFDHWEEDLEHVDELIALGSEHIPYNGILLCAPPVLNDLQKEEIDSAPRLEKRYNEDLAWFFRIVRHDLFKPLYGKHISDWFGNSETNYLPEPELRLLLLTIKSKCWIQCIQENTQSEIVLSDDVRNEILGLLEPLNKQSFFEGWQYGKLEGWHEKNTASSKLFHKLFRSYSGVQKELRHHFMHLQSGEQKKQPRKISDPYEGIFAKSSPSPSTDQTFDDLKKAAKEEITKIAISLNARLALIGMKPEEKGILVCDQALEQATKKEHIKEVLEFARHLKDKVLTNDHENQGMKAFQMIRNADPSIFFEFCRKPLLTMEQVRTMAPKMLQTLEETCPNRTNQHKETLSSFCRKMTGVGHTNSILFVGNPGNGKSFAAIALAKGQSSAGLKTEWCVQSMTQSSYASAGSVETEMRLLGSDHRWSNGSRGVLSEKAMSPDVKCVIAILDEADKGPGHRNLMINLLDPDQVLEDNFIRGFVPHMDMRHKVFFILTANKTIPLHTSESDPLWSRLRPVRFPDYSKKEMIEVIQSILAPDLNQHYGIPKNKCREIIEKHIENVDTSSSFRKILDDITHQAFQSAVPELRGESNFVQLHPKRKTGFYMLSSKSLINC